MKTSHVSLFGAPRGATTGALVACLVLPLLLLACDPAGNHGVTGATVSFSFSDAGATTRHLGRGVYGLAGDSGTADLTSLRYYVASVTLYSALTPSGSGFDIPADAKSLVLYSTSWKPGDPYTEADAIADDSKYVDLLNAAQAGQLAKSAVVDSTAVGTWNWAVVQVTPYVKVTGSVYLGGTTLYTHPATQTTATHGTPFAIAASATALSSATGKGETLFRTSGGGMYYRLEIPLDITQADIDAESEFTLRFAVETEGALQGWKSGASTGTGSFGNQSGSDFFLGWWDGSGYNEQIYAPVLNIVPILTQSSQTVMREHYVIKASALPSPCDISLNLYWLQGDATRSLVGSEVHGMVGNNYTPTGEPYSPPIWGIATPYSYMIDGGTGAMTFYDFQGHAVVANFLRLTNQLDLGGTQPTIGNSAVPATSYSLVTLQPL
jgi:hypothetical protein